MTLIDKTEFRDHPSPLFFYSLKVVFSICIYCDYMKNTVFHFLICFIACTQSEVKRMPSREIKDTTITLWRRKWQPSPVFWPGKSHGQRDLAGYSPWAAKNRT